MNASPGSSAPTAGPATTTSTQANVSSAGLTCSATSPPTAKASQNNTTSDAQDCRRTRSLRRLGAVPADHDRAALQARIAPLQTKLRTELEHAARKSTTTKYHRHFARNLLKRWPALWTFTHTDGVEPTNNHAERGLRGAVIYRKLSLGTQSERGERTIERLLSASVTCRLRKQSLFDYLTEVITAHARGDPYPPSADNTTG